MTSFDTTLLAPARGQLEAVVYEAVDALHRDANIGPATIQPRFEATSRRSLQELWSAMEFEAVGHRAYHLRQVEVGGRPLASLLVAWWCDYLRRRHVRVVGGMPSRDGAVMMPGWEIPVLACIYPEHTLMYSPHGRSEVRHVCECGAAGTAEALGWMGTCCAPCFDREDGDRVSLCRWRDHQAGITALAVSPDGRLLASADAAGTVLVRDLGSGTITDRRDGQGRVTKLVFPPGETEVYTGQGRADCFAFTPAGDLVTYRNGDRHVVLWGEEDGRRLNIPGPAAVTDLAVSPDGRHLAACTGEASVYLLHLHSGQVVDHLRLGYFAQPAQFSPDGRYLAVPTRAGGIVLYDRGLERMVACLGGWMGSLMGYVFTPDSERVLVLDDACLRPFAVQTQTATCTVAAPDAGDDRFRALAITPDGQWLALGRESGTVALWPMSLLGAG